MASDAMMNLEDARSLVLAHARSLPEETVPLKHALGRILLRDVYLDSDIPPFDKSAVDGFACRRCDLPGKLEVIGEIPAGERSPAQLASNQCIAIMTGAPMPDGADCVVMREDAINVGEGKIHVATAPVANNYCNQGQDLQAGTLLLSRGTRLAPQHLASLATTGCTAPWVAAAPRVGILATGSELVAPESTAEPGKIRNSNSVQLAALLQLLGATTVDLGIACDTQDALYQALAHGIQTCDVVLSTGGVSVGTYDLVPEVAQDLGLQELIRKIAIQPGKPMLFATGPQCDFFGLSGNPVSSFVQFLLFVQPYLLCRMGLAHPTPVLRLPLAMTCERKNASRTLWLPVRIAKDGRAETVDYHGSAHLFSLIPAHGLLAMPIGTTTITKGTMVDLLILPGFLP